MLLTNHKRILVLIVVIIAFSLSLATKETRADVSQTRLIAPNATPISNDQTSNTSGAIRTLMQTGVNQQAILTTSNALPFDNFGGAVALSADGNTAVVGASEKTLANKRTGAVYIYVRSGNTWEQRAELKPDGGARGDQFGASVALSADGNTVVVGAYDTKVGQTLGSGKVYVFIRSGNGWVEQAKLQADDFAPHDNFGYSAGVSSDGNTLIVGADVKLTQDDVYSGAAYIFVRNGGVWTQTAKLVAFNARTLDHFGYRVALSGNGTTAIIGAIGANTNPHANSGAAYVYVNSGSAWGLQSMLIPADTREGGYFGGAVALSHDGSTALIGAYSDHREQYANFGSAYIFARNGTRWTQQNKLVGDIVVTNDYFGVAVALSADGRSALIGSQFEDVNGDLNNGTVYLFERSGVLWLRQARFATSDSVNTDLFGRAVALSANARTALIGAGNEAYGSNLTSKAYIFNLTPPEPTATPSSTPRPPRPDTIGVYKAGVFYLRHQNAAGAADITANFGGDASDLPVVGDWNGDGVDTIGVYRSSTGVFFLSDSNTAPSIAVSPVFGNPGDTPFAGRWSADMTGSGLGVYRNSNGLLYQRKSLTSGVNDFFAVFGDPGDIAFAGDWDVNGFDSVGVYRPNNVTWYLTNNSQPDGITFSDYSYSWNSGVHLPVIGDWNGDGVSTTGYFASSTNANFTLNNTAHSAPSTPLTFAFGPTGGKPIAGKWTAASGAALGNIIVSGVNIGQPGMSNPDGGDNTD
jgi:hypothetical protein